jgi:hypothetical protein
MAAVLAGCVDARDSDRDGTLDLDDPDDDNDGMPDAWEEAASLDPKDPADAGGDADGDGLSNAAEHARGTKPQVPDTDGDGVPDGTEASRGLAPLDPADGALDLDGDGLSNAREAALRTDPALVDTDADTMSDAWETAHGLDPTAAGDGGGDADGDGLANAGEASFGADPHVPDSDGDGMPDGWEAAHGLDPARASDAAEDPDGDSFDMDFSGRIDPGEAFGNAREYRAGSDPQAADSDGDLLPDGYEWLCGLDPKSPADALLDADGDGLTNLNESRAGSVASRPDSDGDGMGDAFEVAHGFAPRDAADGALDADADGLNNSAEAARHGDPHDPDTDEDGVRDGDDADPARNLTVTLRIVFLNVTFAPQPTEAGYDPPWELAFALAVQGGAPVAVNFSLVGSTPSTGESVALSVSFTVDADDSAASAAFSLALFERDLPETVGVDEDDALDLDPTVGGGLTLEFAVSLDGATISGEVGHGTADGAADGRPSEHDARIAFSVSLGPA